MATSKSLTTTLPSLKRSLTSLRVYTSPPPTPNQQDTHNIWSDQAAVIADHANCDRNAYEFVFCPRTSWLHALAHVQQLPYSVKRAPLAMTKEDIPAPSSTAQQVRWPLTVTSDCECVPVCGLMGSRLRRDRGSLDVKKELRGAVMRPHDLWGQTHSLPFHLPSWACQQADTRIDV